MTQPNSLRQETGDLRINIASNPYTSNIDSFADTSPAMCVVEAVAEATETDLEDLKPLYDAIDPDALNQLIGSPRQFTEGRIQFRYAGCDVTVDADGSIAVFARPTDGE